MVPLIREGPGRGCEDGGGEEHRTATAAAAAGPNRSRVRRVIPAFA